MSIETDSKAIHLFADSIEYKSTDNGYNKDYCIKFTKDNEVYFYDHSQGGSITRMSDDKLMPKLLKQIRL